MNIYRLAVVINLCLSWPWGVVRSGKYRAVDVHKKGDMCFLVLGPFSFGACVRKIQCDEQKVRV